MSTENDVARSLRSWLREDRHEDADRVLDAVIDQVPATPQRRALWLARRFPDLNSNTVRFGVAAAVLIVAVVFGINFLARPRVGGDPTQTPVEVAPGAGTPLGWSSDGTRLLIQRGNETLLILHADGSETKVADISKFNDPGSARPAGATISPDGSRVVFAGLTKTSEEGHLSCHDGALFAVDAEGGPAEVLWESQVPQNGIVRYPTFSPDGTRIAFADGYCDHDHSVWVMNADGSDAHQIVANETTLGAGHVYGLAWSAAGDRIALQFEGATYTFATDGSDFTQVSASEFCWPGRRC
jgi:Tol biopolymer transport system component